MSQSELFIGLEKQKQLLEKHLITAAASEYQLLLSQLEALRMHLEQARVA